MDVGIVRRPSAHAERKAATRSRTAPMELVDGLGLLALTRAIEGRRGEAVALAVQARDAGRALGTDPVSAVLPELVLGSCRQPARRASGAGGGQDALVAALVALARAGLHSARGDAAAAADVLTRLGLPVRPSAARAGAGQPMQLVEPLTAREREVLTLLGDLLTTEEVARSLYVSVNTVKSHIRGILRKLEVRRRNEAVRRARELRLIA